MREVAYTYLPDEEMAKMSGQLVVGAGRFQVLESDCKPSKNSGNMQIIIDFKVWDSYGNEAEIRDYFPLTASCAWKMKAFLMSIGEKYEKDGKINLDLIQGKTGSCKLKIEKFTGNNGEQKESVKIGSYTAPSSKNDSSVPEVQAVVGDETPDDEIPF